jgi:hypothetical protein
MGNGVMRRWALAGAVTLSGGLVSGALQAQSAAECIAPQ